jgi:hypothetical protein
MTGCRLLRAAAVLFAFDLIENLPLTERKRRLDRLLGRAKRRSIQC